MAHERNQAVAISKYVTPEVQVKIKQLMDYKKAIEQIEAELKDGLLEVMQENYIKSFKGDEYTISKSSRETITFTGDTIPEEFQMIAVDMKKVKAKQVLEGKLPADFEIKTSEYITFRSKK